MSYLSTKTKEFIINESKKKKVLNNNLKKWTIYILYQIIFLQIFLKS